MKGRFGRPVLPVASGGRWFLRAETTGAGLKGEGFVTGGGELVSEPVEEESAGFARAGGEEEGAGADGGWQGG